jgi:hypothetical protein
VADPEHVKRRLRQAVEVWNTWRGRAGMLLAASLRRAKGMTIPKIAAWVRIAAVIIAAVAVLELLFAIWWWVGLHRSSGQCAVGWKACRRDFC